MNKLSDAIRILTIALFAAAALIAGKTCYERNSLGFLAAGADNTRCEEFVFPMIVEDLQSIMQLRAYRHEGLETVGDTISGSFGSSLGMRISLLLRVDCLVDLSGFSAENITIADHVGSPLEITVYLPQPIFSHVEIIGTEEFPLYIRHLDNAAESEAIMRQYLVQEALSQFQLEALRSNAIGMARQSAENTVREIVEGVLASQGIIATVRVEFGSSLSPNTASTIAPENVHEPLRQKIMCSRVIVVKENERSHRK